MDVCRPAQAPPTEIKRLQQLLRSVVTASMQWLAETRSLVGYVSAPKARQFGAPGGIGSQLAAQASLARKGGLMSGGIEVPFGNTTVPAHVLLAPEMDIGDEERRYSRSPDGLQGLVERGEALLPVSLQTEIFQCLEVSGLQLWAVSRA